MTLSTKCFLKKVGESIRGYRISTNLTLDELSQKSDVSKVTLSKIENGKANPSILVLRRILRVLDREDQLMKLFSEPSSSPIQASYKLYRLLSPTKRKRVRKKNKVESKSDEWRWED